MFLLAWMDLGYERDKKLPKLFKNVQKWLKIAKIVKSQTKYQFNIHMFSYVGQYVKTNQIKGVYKHS